MKVTVSSFAGVGGGVGPGLGSVLGFGPQLFMRSQKIAAVKSIFVLEKIFHLFFDDIFGSVIILLSGVIVDRISNKSNYL